MQLSDLPANFIPMPWAKDAASGQIRTVPATTATPGAASWDLGFPPECFVPLGAGGYAPDGRDWQGAMNVVSAWAQWQMAGGPTYYSAAFSTLVGGYPEGALLQSNVTVGLQWQSTVDNNTNDPDVVPTGWEAVGVMRPMPALTAKVNPTLSSATPQDVLFLDLWGQAIQNQQYTGAVAGVGSPNSINIGFAADPPSGTSPPPNLFRICFQQTGTNTSTTVTLNVNLGTAYRVKKLSAGSYVDPAVGDLVDGHFYDIVFNLGLLQWQLLSPVG